MFFRTDSPQNLVLVLFMALGVTAGPVGRLTGELEQTLQHIAEKTGTENDESWRSDRLLLSVILRDFSILLQDIAVAIEREALQGKTSEGSAEEFFGEQEEELEEEEEDEKIASNDENIEHIANNDEHDENAPSFGEHSPHAHVQPNADHNEGYFLATDDLVPEEVEEETVDVVEEEEEEEEEEEGREATANDGSLDNEFPVLSKYLPPSDGQPATDHGPESKENIATNDENNEHIGTNDDENNEIENVATNDENNDENIATNNNENEENIANNDENHENVATNDENDEIENVATNDENNADITSNNENNENIANNEEHDENIVTNDENNENIATNNENDENIASNNENDDNIANNMPSLGDNEEEGTHFDENHGDEASQPAATDDAVDDGSVISTDDFASAGSSREWSPFDENVATLGRGGPSVSIQRPHTHAGRHGGDSDDPGHQPFSGRWSPFSSDAPSFGKHPPHPHARPSGRHLPPHSPVNSQPEVQQARWLELINKMRKPKANPASVVGRWSPFDKNPPTFGRNPAG